MNTEDIKDLKQAVQYIESLLICLESLGMDDMTDTINEVLDELNYHLMIGQNMKVNEPELVFDASDEIQKSSSDGLDLFEEIENSLYSDEWV